jgi:hypothetical protein
MAGQPTLLCIPDISGFTEFMADIDFELSSKIIPSLLNKIIYSNEIGLKISEIEGDAVLFYRSGELPTFKELVKQCKFFYTEFYEQLRLLKEQNGSIPGAKHIPKILGLKIVLHFGDEIGVVPIGNRIKLMGEDVIVAHRLLKNNIDIDEYILISQELMDQYRLKGEQDDFDWLEFVHGQIEVNHIGTVIFNYLQLNAPLKRYLCTFLV